MEFMMPELVREDLRRTAVEIVEIQWTYQTKKDKWNKRFKKMR